MNILNFMCNYHVYCVYFTLGKILRQRSHLGQQSVLFAAILFLSVAVHFFCWLVTAVHSPNSDFFL